MTESQTNNLPLSTEPQPQSINVEFQRLYVKEQSCKVPHGTQAFQVKGQPEININADAIYNAEFPPVFLLHIDFSSLHQQRVPEKNTETLEKIKVFSTQPTTAENTNITVH